jgi:hypothetical protein
MQGWAERRVEVTEQEIRQQPQMHRQGKKTPLATGGLDKALQARARHFGAAEVDDDQAPVRRCHRYLIGRGNQLNYREALGNDLPIGPGEIESAHRYIAQLRLKRPGAWWRVEHAEYMRCASIVERRLEDLLGHVRQKQLARRKSEPDPYHEKTQRDCITLDRTRRFWLSEGIVSRG